MSDVLPPDPNDVPQAAIDFMKGKKLTDSFSHKEVWAEEHAMAFTVAKSAGYDITHDIRESLTEALAKGTTLDQWKKQIAPTLQAKGWWGKKDAWDPVSKQWIPSQLGSSRRLNTIYQTNVRQAYQVAQNKAGYDSPVHTQICYKIGSSAHHRAQHVDWDGLILDKNDPFWLSHMPINAYGCNCYLCWLTDVAAQRLKSDGIPVINDPETNEVTIQDVKTKPPKDSMGFEPYNNDLRGVKGTVPKGIDPGFDWNPALFGRSIPLNSNIWQKAMAFTKPDQGYTSLKKLILTPQIQEGYGNFVDNFFENPPTKASPAKISQLYTVGMMGDEILAAQKYNKYLRNGTIGMPQSVLSGTKFDRHKLADNALSLAEFKALPQNLSTATAYWDTRSKKLVYVYPANDGTDRIVKVVIDTGSLKNTSIDYASVDTVFKVTPESIRTEQYVKLK